MKPLQMAAIVLCLMEGTAMADQVSFAKDATGAAPQGWTVTMTGQGTPKWTVEEDSERAIQIQGRQAIGPGDVPAVA